MRKEEIVSKKTPQAIGPYSQAIKFGELIFCAGQIGAHPKTNLLAAGGIKEQTKQVFENLKNVLKEGGSDLDNVLKVNVYLQDMDDFPAMNEVYATFFEKPYPARATVEVARLPKGALIEIECVAYIKDYHHEREGRICSSCA